MGYTATVMIYRLSFIDSTSDFFNTFDIVMNVIFGVDIIITFF